MDYKNKSNIEVDSHTGTWHTIEDTMIDNKQYFLLEHDEYGDEAASIIIDTNGKLIIDDVWNGFADLEEHFDSLEMNDHRNSKVHFAVEEKFNYEEIPYEVAYKVGEFSLYVQSVDDGFAYTLYDKNLNGIDGGLYDDLDSTLTEAIHNIIEGFDVVGMGNIQDRTAELLEVTEFIEKVDSAEKQQLDSKKLEQVFEKSKENRYAVYQLKDSDYTRGFRFEGIAYLEKNHIKLEDSNYNTIYTDHIPEFLQGRNVSHILNQLYEKLNMDRPIEFEGHNLSVSDIIALKIDGKEIGRASCRERVLRLV